jgi:hypothetical protein
MIQTFVAQINAKELQTLQPQKWTKCHPWLSRLRNLAISQVRSWKRQGFWRFPQPFGC